MTPLPNRNETEPARNVRPEADGARAAAEEATGQIPSPGVYDDVLRSEKSSTPSGSKVDGETLRRTIGQPRGANEVTRTKR